MKKILTTLAIASVAVLGASAAELQNYFNQKVRPVSSMAMNVPESELKEDGLKSSSVAMLSNEAMDKLVKEECFISPVELMIDSNENDAIAKVWMCPGDEDGITEVLLFNRSGDGNIVMFASGPLDAVNKLMEE